MKRAILLCLITLFYTVQGYSQNVEYLEKSHVHEAFMNVEASITLLTAIPLEPPQPLQEQMMAQPDPQTVWVPGYWDWSMDRNEFVWCSGSWRRPPPNHQWIPGSWTQLNEGWVRLKGFWSSVPVSNLSYIPTSPPDPYNENPSARPGKEYFWMAGYWKYANNKYAWFTGKWEGIDANWIYTPPRYVWRPEGYVFVPAFWDWPLDQRGTAYVCVAFTQAQQQITYIPDMIVAPADLIEGCLLYYPDYYYFYYYYWYFHVDWWQGCAWCPPWWGWGDWWWMPWCDHWGLWWWWCHPGFPAPFWMDPAFMHMMSGPPMALMDAMKHVHPPLIVGPHGLIPPANLLDATDNDKPIFPQDPTGIQDEAGQTIDQGSTDRPSGSQWGRCQCDLSGSM